jgi:hypothetical protein
MSGVGGWKLGPMGLRLPDGKYVLTPAGQAEFDARYAARQNPTGLVKINWPHLYRLAVKILGRDVSNSGWVGLWRAILTYPEAPKYTLNTWAQWTTRLVIQRELYWLADRRTLRPDGAATPGWDRDEPPEWDEIYSAGCDAHDPTEPLERVDTAAAVQKVLNGLPARDHDILADWMAGEFSQRTADKYRVSGAYIRARRDVLLKKLAHKPELMELVA